MDTQHRTLLNTTVYLLLLFIKKKSISIHQKNIRKPWTSARIKEITEILLSCGQAKEKRDKRSNEQHFILRIFENMENGGERAVIKKV